MSSIRYHGVRVTVDSIRGKCPLGMKVGNEFMIKSTTPAGMCMGAFGSLFSYIQVLKFGGSFPWEKDPDAALIGCPDHINQVVYKLERMPMDSTD